MSRKKNSVQVQHGYNLPFLPPPYHVPLLQSWPDSWVQNPPLGSVVWVGATQNNGGGYLIEDLFGNQTIPCIVRKYSSKTLGITQFCAVLLLQTKCLRSV